MIKLEVNREKRFIKDSFVVRADEPMRVSVDVSNTGHMIVYGYTGVEDDTEQDPVILYDSESIINDDMLYQDEKKQ